MLGSGVRDYHMTVYVDEPLFWPTIKAAPRVKYWCHMMADSVEELHEMAANIGLKREWFQMSNSGLPHYDLTKSRRKLATLFGALDLPEDTTWCLDFFRRIRLETSGSV